MTEMTEFDKKIKRLSKDFPVSETYYEKVGELLETIRQNEAVTAKSDGNENLHEAIARGKEHTIYGICQR